MARIFAEIDYVFVTNENGISIEGVCAYCTKCGDVSESYGTGDGSIRRCLALLAEGCEEESKNFYLPTEPLREIL